MYIVFRHNAIVYLICYEKPKKLSHFFIAIFTSLQWSRTEVSLSPKYAFIPSNMEESQNNSLKLKKPKERKNAYLWFSLYRILKSADLTNGDRRFAVVWGLRIEGQGGIDYKRAQGNIFGVITMFIDSDDDFVGVYIIYTLNARGLVYMTYTSIKLLLKGCLYLPK